MAETVHITAMASLEGSLAVGFSDGHVEVLRPHDGASGGSPARQRWAVAARILRQSTPVTHLAWSPYGLAVAQKGGHLMVIPLAQDRCARAGPPEHGPVSLHFVDFSKWSLPPTKLVSHISSLYVVQETF